MKRLCYGLLPVLLMAGITTAQVKPAAAPDKKGSDSCRTTGADRSKTKACCTQPSKTALLRAKRPVTKP